MLTEPEVFEKMLNRFSTLIFGSDSTQEIFEGVGNLCLELLNLEDLSIFLADHKNKILKQTLIVEKGQKLQYDADGGSFITLPLNKGIVGRCATTLETISVDNVALDMDYVADQIVCKSEIAVPIVFRNHLIGVLDSESSHLARYDNKIQSVLEGIASLLAIKLNELDKVKELESKNNELKSLIQGHPAGVAMLNREGNFITVSKRWMTQFTKKSKADLQGVNLFSLYPNLPIRWVKIIENAQKGEATTVKGETYTRYNGKLEFIDASVNPWYTNTKEIGGVVIMADNVTEQVQNKIDLQQTTEKLTEAASIARIFNWSFDTESGYFQWDGNEITVTDFPSDTKFDLDRVFQLIDQDYHADFNNAITKAIEEHTSFEIIHPFTLGENRYWLHNRGKVAFKDGVVAEIVGTAQDITDQVDAENAIKSQNLALRKVNQELDQFVYKTAHDLRAPLTNIMGLIGIMRLETIPKLLSSYLDLQEKSIEKLDNFIQKITANTKNTRLPIANEKIDFGLLIDEVLRAHYFIENSDKISKILNIDKEIAYFGDKERLGIIITALVSNAIHFCDLEKETPSIAIDISTVNDLLRIKVRDNGLGIEEQYQPKVCDMFYRAHKKADGAGIGLYIVKETVKKLNDSIHLASEAGSFTEINVFLPNHKAEIK